MITRGIPCHHTIFLLIYFRPLLGTQTDVFYLCLSVCLSVCLSLFENKFSLNEVFDAKERGAGKKLVGEWGVVR